MQDNKRKQLQMNLPTSSSHSKQPVKRGAPSGKQKGDNDLPLKLAAARVFMCQGYFVKTNLGLSEAQADHSAKSILVDITDIDVMAFKYNYDFTPFTICMSCKGGEARSLKAIKESFYLRGVMDYFNGHRGYVVISKKRVDSHARILASKLDIIILEGDEFDEWCRNAIDTCDVICSPFWENEFYNNYQEEFNKIEQISSLRNYLIGDYWFYRDFRNIQNIIAHTKRVKEFLKKESLPVRLIILEATTSFALSVLDLCRYVTSAGIKDIKDHIAAYLFGGVTSLRSRRELYVKLDTFLKTHGIVEEGGPQLPSLIPEYTDRLVELVYRWISKPMAAVLVPQFLQHYTWELIITHKKGGTVNFESLCPKYKETVIKFADDLIELFTTICDTYREKLF